MRTAATDFPQRALVGLSELQQSEMSHEKPQNETKTTKRHNRKPSKTEDTTVTKGKKQPVNRHAASEKQVK